MRSEVEIRSVEMSGVEICPFCDDEIDLRWSCYCGIDWDYDPEQGNFFAFLYDDDELLKRYKR